MSKNKECIVPLSSAEGYALTPHEAEEKRQRISIEYEQIKQGLNLSLHNDNNMLEQIQLKIKDLDNKINHLKASKKEIISEHKEIYTFDLTSIGDELALFISNVEDREYIFTIITCVRQFPASRRKSGDIYYRYGFILKDLINHYLSDNGEISIDQFGTNKRKLNTKEVLLIGQNSPGYWVSPTFVDFSNEELFDPVQFPYLREYINLLVTKRLESNNIRTRNP